MSTHKDEIWSAYLDGELTAGEATEFDASLTPEDRERLEGEMRFEAALAETLGEGPDCPDELWQQLREDMGATPDNISFLRRPVTVRTLVPIAAVAAVLVLSVVGIYEAYQVDAEIPFLNVADAEAQGLAELSELASPNEDQVEDYLRRHGMNVYLRDPEHTVGLAHPNQTRLIGAFHREFKGSGVVVLLYECCGKPVLVPLVKRGSAAEAAIRSALGDSKCQVRSFAEVGDCTAFVVGKHPGAGTLLNALADVENEAQ
jgi:hypothetical protein